MVENHNPYAAPAMAPPVADLPGQFVSVHRHRWSQVLAVVCVAGSPIASALAVWDIETILGSGPVLALSCSVLTLLAWTPRLRPLLWISACGMAIVLGCFFVINIFEWGPAEAQQPIGQATILLALIMQAGWIPIGRVARAYRHSSGTREQPGESDGMTETSPH